jgi:hypothetical protein
MNTKFHQSVSADPGRCARMIARFSVPTPFPIQRVAVGDYVRRV